MSRRNRKVVCYFIPEQISRIFFLKLQRIPGKSSNICIDHSTYDQFENEHVGTDGINIFVIWEKVTNLHCLEILNLSLVPIEKVL